MTTVYNEDSLCPMCDNNSMVKSTRNEIFTFPVTDDEKLTIIVPDMEHWTCTICKEGFFQGDEMEKADKAIKEAKHAWFRENLTNHD